MLFLDKIQKDALETRIVFIVIFLIFLGVLTYAYYVDMPRTSERFENWGKSIEYYKQYWITGFGLGHWKTFGIGYVKNTGGYWWSNAHNAYLQALFELGIVFPFILLGYCVSLVRRYNKSRLLPLTAIIIAAANSLVSFNMQIATTAIIAVTWMALYEVMNAPNAIGEQLK